MQLHSALDYYNCFNTTSSVITKYFNRNYGKHIGECTISLDKTDYGREYILTMRTSTGLSYKSKIDIHPTFKPDDYSKAVQHIEQQIIDDLDKDLPYSDRKVREIYERTNN